MTQVSVPTERVRAAYEHHARYLWGMAYRMTGSATEADDVLQDSFIALQQSPPADLERPLRPWLTRVAANLCHDRYRARQHLSYPGPWLPEPVQLDDLGWARRELDAGGEVDDTENIVGQRWSAAFGFLVALERLGPTQRAVFVLRELLELSTAEAAEAIGVSASSVKVALHRARENLGDEEARVQTRTPARLQQARAALDSMLTLFAQQDLPGVLETLDDAAILLSDGGGIVRAAMQEMVGRVAVAKLMMGLARKRMPIRVEPIEINGAVGYDMHFVASDPRDAARSILLVELSAAGKIDRVWTVLSPPKLAHV